MRLLKLVPDDTNIHFLKWRNVAMAIGVGMIVASLILTFVRGLNFGVDFVGGQSTRVEFSEQIDISDIRAKTSALGFGDATVQEIGDNEVLVRTPVPEGDDGATNEAADKLKNGILAAYPKAKVGSVDSVSGKVSGELLQTGALSLILAMLAISVYIWFRFEWQFGVGALFALLHDVSLTFGFFALTQLEFNLNIVAALLTIIGYSLNDTIVVFDRIRENLKKYRKMDMTALLDLSVNETLARTVMTSLTMIIALVALLLLGPDVIYGFTAAMLLGLFVGTYSSVYMAAPWLIWLHVKSDSFVPVDSGTGTAERVTDDGARV